MPKKLNRIAAQKKPHGKPDTQCIAHCLSGLRCTRQIEMPFSAKHKTSPVPYCEKHLRWGDGAFKVHKHPKGYGKILVARYNLPKGYRMVYHGVRKTTGQDADLDPDEAQCCNSRPMEAPAKWPTFVKAIVALGAVMETMQGWSTCLPCPSLLVGSWSTTMDLNGGKIDQRSSVPMWAQSDFPHHKEKLGK
ncbi:Hypothetical protein (Fragment) [Durusdinium trenchii]|uniref:Uncharacterized protein n=1 Tax=Durusdinium trenchii TaxID=1381693 RepID=A0ABP0KHY9_9DINO